MSRLQNARKAERLALKARLLVTGPPGAGKTWTALRIAQTLGERVTLFDTERLSALTYADEFDFTHVPWDPPFDTDELAHDLGDVDADVAIVDSFSHFWHGRGGTLDQADGRFGGWKNARPKQERVIDAFQSAGVHVILCVRSKIEYVQQLNEQGKQEVKKLGMAVRQDDTLEYEVDMVADMDLAHTITIGKSRSSQIPVGEVFAGSQVDAFAERYRAWLELGQRMATEQEVEALQHAISELSAEGKQAAMVDWQKEGLPPLARLMARDVEKALTLITLHLAGHDPSTGSTEPLRG